MVYITGGGTYYSYEGLSSFMLGRIYGKVPQINGYKAIIGTGYKTVLLNRPISMQYEWYRGGYLDELTDDDDIDKDGLYDYQEILFRSADNPSGKWLINVDDPYEIKLYTFSEIKNKIGDGLFYVEKGLNRYCRATGDYTKSVESLNSARILPIKSDPTNSDADYDGVLDVDDVNGLDTRFNALLTCWYNKDGTEIATSDVDYSFDLTMFFNNRYKYNIDLAITSSLMSAIVYDDRYLTIADNKINADDFMKLHRFDNIEICDLADKCDRCHYTKYFDSHVSKMFIGHKTINNNNKKELIAVFVEGTEGSIEQWTSNFDVGSTLELSAYNNWIKSMLLDTQNAKNYKNLKKSKKWVKTA